MRQRQHGYGDVIVQHPRDWQRLRRRAHGGYERQPRARRGRVHLHVPAGVKQPHVEQRTPEPAERAAALPAKLLLVFQGSAFPAPSRLPTMSASPSPPHISDSAAIPPGLVRQKHAVTVSRTSVYMNGPPSSSFLSPSRETARTAFSFATTPEPMANSRARAEAPARARRRAATRARRRQRPRQHEERTRRRANHLAAQLAFQHLLRREHAEQLHPQVRRDRRAERRAGVTRRGVAQRGVESLHHGGRAGGGAGRPDGANENAESAEPRAPSGASATPTAATIIVRPRAAETQRRGVCVLSRAVPTDTGGWRDASDATAIARARAGECGRTLPCLTQSQVG